MIAILAGITIPLALTRWVLQPLLARAPGGAPPPNCPSCGAPTRPDARFCAECGAELAR